MKQINENYPIDFSANPFLTVKDCIEHLQRRVILASIAYYEFDKSLISDSLYDDISRQLVYYVSVYPNEARQSVYAYVFIDFDGSTGFDIPSNLNADDRSYLKHLAYVILESQERGNKQK